MGRRRYMSIYTKLYSGAGKGDTWTLSNETSLNPRAQAVEAAASRFQGQIDVLDVGCGRGVNSLWTIKLGGSWTGVDTESAEKIGLNLPAGARFEQGNICSDELQKNLGKFDLIVDQGAELVEIDNQEDLEKYLESVSRMVKEGGRFVALFLHQFEGESGSTVIFPDGRKRGLWTAEEATKICAKYFQVESGLGFEHAYSYLPGEHNPLGAQAGDSRQITLFHLVLKKI